MVIEVDVVALLKFGKSLGFDELWLLKLALRVLQLLYSVLLQVQIFSEPVSHESRVLRLVAVGGVDEDPYEELIHADPVHAIEGEPYIGHVSLALFLSRQVDAQVDRGDEGHDEVEGRDQVGDGQQGLRGSLLWEGVEVAELGHRGRWGVVRGRGRDGLGVTALTASVYGIYLGSFDIIGIVMLLELVLTIGYVSLWGVFVLFALHHICKVVLSCWGTYAWRL